MQRDCSRGGWWAPFVMALVIAACCSPDVHGEALDSPVTVGHSVTMWSQILEEQRQLLIHVPPDYATSQRHYPVLYVLDGEEFFLMATGIVDFLGKGGRIPEMIVVSVTTNAQRTRDLTADEMLTEQDRKEGEVGAAAQFLRFLADELVPWVDSRYRTEPFRVLFGHSRGGAFNVFALMNRPEVFPVQIAASGALWRNDQALVPLAAPALRKLPASRFHFLSLSWGDESWHGRRGKRGAGELPAASRALVALLEKSPPPNLEFHHQVYPDDDHLTTPHHSLYDGLLKLYPDWWPNAPVRAADLQAVEQHYQRLSAKYGYSIAVPVDVLVNLGRALLEQGKTADALRIFQRAVRTYPHLAVGYGYVAEVQEQLGQLEAAAQGYRRAFEIAVESEPLQIEYHRYELDRFRSAQAAMPGVASAHALLQRFNEAAAPGGTVGVVNLRTGEWLYRDAFGLADIARGTANTPATIYGIASVTKQFTAAAAALAAQQGHFSLDDDIRQYLPEMPAYPRPVTIRQLAQHTSGLRDDVWLVDLTGRPDLYQSQEQILRLIIRQRGVNFAAGDQYTYSNTNYLLLSEIIERTTRRSLADYAQEFIFRPLQMTNTYYYREPRPESVAIPYERRKNEWVAGEGPDWSGRGTGGIMTTMDDYAKWAANLVAPHSKLAGGVALTRMLRTPARLSDGSTSLYGFGLELDPYRGLETVSHSGSGGGYRASTLIFPSRTLAVIAMWNNGIYPDATARSIADIFLDDMASGSSSAPAKEKAIELPIARLQALVGTYRETSVGWPMVIELQQSGLTATYRSPAMPIMPLSPVRFRSEDDRGIDFEVNAKGRGVRLRQSSSWRFAGGVFERIEPVAPNADELSAYTGDFYSAELDVTYRIGIDKGQLTAEILGAAPTEPGSAADRFVFQPLLKNEFASIPSRVVLHFKSRAASSASAFTLAAQYGRVTGVEFVRRSARSAGRR